MGYRGWGGYPPYVPVAEKKAKAARKLKALKKKNPNIRPIVIEGRLIAKTWWGKSWNKNLERYADYSNRIGRGRSYVRHGAVLDLQIHPGEVKALVQGSRSKPYSVNIRISRIDAKTWKGIRTACQGKLDSLSELLAGKFPKDLGGIFTAKGHGLFPSPREIQFDCSCPDRASMCKHVAAVLYGVGARLDEDPSLFFKLRKADVDDLITQAVEEKTRKLLEQSEITSERVMEDSDLSDIFGIEMDEPASTAAPEKEDKVKPAVRDEPVRETVAKQTGKTGKKGLEIRIGKTRVSFSFQFGKNKNTAETESPEKTVRKQPAKAKPLTKTVISLVRRSRKGISVSDIREKTGFDVRQIRNALYMAKKQGKIRRVGRGVYKKA